MGSGWPSRNILVSEDNANHRLMLICVAWVIAQAMEMLRHRMLPRTMSGSMIVQMLRPRVMSVVPVAIKGFVVDWDMANHLELC